MLNKLLKYRTIYFRYCKNCLSTNYYYFFGLTIAMLFFSILAALSLGIKMSVILSFPL